ERAQLLRHPSSGPAPPPSSPTIPEIRITFPEEVDEVTGKRQAGRVVVVRMGDSTTGLEPYDEEKEGEELPAYRRQNPEERFHSLDLDRIGGLKEVCVRERPVC
ncbi:hypothetical protein LTR28_009933, partial [Elasticomyces elasticus]